MGYDVDGDGSPLADVLERRVDAVIERLPGWARGPVDWFLSTWIGRTLLRVAGACVRVEIFDRAMTIAAQFFSSILPLLIVAVTFLGSGSEQISDVIGATGSSEELIDQAVRGSSTAAFGVVGALLVLVSATSLSRALTRAFAVVWQVERPRMSLRSAWRWFAVVMVLLMAVVVVQNLTQRAGVLPPRFLWPTALSLATDVIVAIFVPWVLLAGRVVARWMVPGAVAFGLVMMVVRPAADVWLPWALDVSAERYGPIGMAFTYLAWLYVVAFVFIGTAVIGQVVVSDRGRAGAWLRGQHGLTQEA
ncbi:YhjD/YihY/BrkB family envelope integrity protein [Aeromicrobium choanae]|uniref:Membrane protein n=1 Tax=Aeromicrobium choanae TaxID=1736691 RepID=A0A1T4Z9E1_9ACTN|nr:YhjD/YihY/BrkB family envelope integrity protein [Aeromicrobium choanae]SKB10231.1 membrane protein [Aeromicrobium choanae]